MSHLLKCRCGTLQGYVDALETANRGICYGRDCQAFARYLGRESEILDEHAGTEVFQLNPRQWRRPLRRVPARRIRSSGRDHADHVGTVACPAEGAAHCYSKSGTEGARLPGPGALHRAVTAPKPGMPGKTT